MRRIVCQYEVLLASAVCAGWSDWQALGELAPLQRGRLGRGARAFDVNDFIAEHVRRRFADVGGVVLTEQHGRPVLLAADGLVQFRFKKLDRRMELAAARTARQRMLAFHECPPVLPGMPQPTTITIGYVLDSSETQLTRVAAVCHVGRSVRYAIDLPVPQAGAKIATLPRGPLSEPVLRPARGQRSPAVQSSTGG